MKSPIALIGSACHRIRQLRFTADSRSPLSADALCATTVKETARYTRWSPPHPLFTPWVGESEFSAVYDGVAPHTLVSVDRCYILASLALHAANLPGAFAEAGVFRGGTALLLARIASRRQRRLLLFDSFEGLPDPDPRHDNYYARGDFHAHETEVRDLLKDFAYSVEIHEGWIPGTFAGLGDELFSFVHVDVDLYTPALECCRYFFPRLVFGGVMLFDDYGFPACRGEKDAVDEYFSGVQDKPIVLHSGQAFVLKAAG